MPLYIARHLTGPFGEPPCGLVQLEDAYAAMYFNIIHGAGLGRRFTTEKLGKASADYLPVATKLDERGLTKKSSCVN